MKTNNIPRDGALVSPWQKELLSPKLAPPAANNEMVFDCMIVGGGITGLTTALLLQQQGKQTLIAEAHTIGFGTTGGTSAHINTFADTTYAEAESAFGEEGARLFAEAIAEGLNLIRENIKNCQIGCDFEEKPGYL